MPFPVAAVIAAGALLTSQTMSTGSGLLSGNMSNQANAKAAHDSFMYNVALQNMQNAWYRRYNDYVRSSAHQFEMNDLMKAGLNPVLTATGGSGAYSSGGSNSAQSVSEASTPYNLDVPNLYHLYNTIRNEKRQTDSNIELQDSQTKLNEKNVVKADREVENLKALTDKYVNEIQNNTALTQSTILNNNAKTLAEINLLNKQAEWLPFNSQTGRIGANANFLNASANDYSVHNDPKKVITDVVQNSSSVADRFKQQVKNVGDIIGSFKGNYAQLHHYQVNNRLKLMRNKIKK